MYAKLPFYKKKVLDAHFFIENALNEVDCPYVAFSFGKDSSVLLHMLMQHNPNIQAVFFSRIETNLTDRFQELNEWWVAKGANIRNVYFEEVSVNNVGKAIIPIAAKKIRHEYDSYFIGLRAEEAKGRRISLKKHGMIYLSKSSNMMRIAPLAFWTVKDIIAYMCEHDIPFLNRYLNQGLTARTVAGISSKFPEDSLSYLRQYDITAFNKVLEVLPDAKFFI